MNCSPTVATQVDADKHRSLGDRFGVKGFPTVLYLARGKPVDKHETCAAAAPPPRGSRVTTIVCVRCKLLQAHAIVPVFYLSGFVCGVHCSPIGPTQE